MVPIQFGLDQPHMAAWSIIPALLDIIGIMGVQHECVKLTGTGQQNHYSV